MHLCAELIAASMTLEPLGEVGANFSLQLSSRTQFTQINNKKVIAENQCEKHKKSSLIGLLRVSEYMDTPHLNIKSSMNIRHCRNQWIAFFFFVFFFTFF